MTTVKYIVPPASGKQEAGLIALAIILILLTCAGMIIIRKEPDNEQKNETWEISAFHDLNSLEQGIYNDLCSSAIEIEALHNENFGKWPDVSDLEEQLLSPFATSRILKRRGRLFWQGEDRTLGDQDNYLYLGATSDPDIVGSFLLIMSHHHSEDDEMDHKADESEPHFTVWLNPLSINSPPSQTTQFYLVKTGWQKIIAYSGRKELMRLGKPVLE